jgi:MFS family permease
MTDISPTAPLYATGVRRLDSRDAKTLLLAALGGALEFYDFVIFIFFAKQLGHLFFPADMPAWMAQLQVYGIFAAGYLARPLGGIVMAHFGDRAGRKRMFALSVFLMALPTLAIGLLPVYAHVGLAAPLLLLLMRVIQGIAIGGEVPGAWVFVAEHVPPGRVGFACATLTSGLTAGILVGSLVAAAINTHMTTEDVLNYGWRLPFVLGGLFGLVAVYLRRWLSETPVFVQMRERKELVRGMPLKSVLGGQLGAVVLSMLVTWMLTAAIVVVILMTPTIVQENFHIEAGRAFVGNSLAAAMLTIGCIVGGLAADRFGRGRSLLVGSVILLAATYALYIDLAHGGGHFLSLYALAGLCVGVVGIVPAIMVAAFPPAIRFSGISFAYNIAYAFFGAVTAPLIGYLASSVGGMAPAHYVAITMLLGVGLGIYLIRTRRTTYER